MCNCAEHSHDFEIVKITTTVKLVIQLYLHSTVILVDGGVVV